MFLESRVFRIWLAVASASWAVLFALYTNFEFLLAHFYYPATMVVGAFVAGSTPQGGGAVAFPVLNIFMDIDRTLARDFGMMIQSIGMTSASIFILTSGRTDRRVFRPLLWWIPIAFAGFVVGMLALQGIEVFIIQALFLSLIASFTVAYLFSRHRGTQGEYVARHFRDRLFTGTMVFAGGMCTSLFGTGVDILLYTVLVTHFTIKEKLATEMSVILMAALSVLGFAYRGLFEGALTEYQVQTWLCAFPVVLVMAPLGAHVLKMIRTEYMLRAVMVLNIAQLIYFNVVEPSLEKFLWSAGCTILLTSVFFFGMAELARRNAVEVLAEPLLAPASSE
jgi:uncharacterized membrane protein YfcA